MHDTKIPLSVQNHIITKKLVINFSYPTAIIFLLFGINYLFKGAILLGSVETIFGILQIINLYLLKKYDNLDINIKILLISIYVMTLIIFIHGGLGNTGNLWILFIPLFTMLLLNSADSIKYILTYIVIVTAILIMNYFNLITLKYSAIELRQTLIVFGVLLYLTFYNERLKERFRHQIQQNNEELQRISTIDHLTGLANRLYSNQFLKDEFERVQRYDHQPLSLIMIDLDHFKEVNDRYGHLKGDEVLIIVSEIFKKHIRQIDLASRWGGEEFMIICPTTTLDGAKAMAEKLRTEIEEADMGLNQSITASFGVTQYKKGYSLSEFIHHADNILYLAKDKGRNIVITG